MGDEPYDGPSSHQFYPDPDSDDLAEGLAPAANDHVDHVVDLDSEDSDDLAAGLTPAANDHVDHVVRRRSRRLSRRMSNGSAGILTRSRAKRTRNLCDHLAPPISCKRAVRCLEDHLKAP